MQTPTNFPTPSFKTVLLATDFSEASETAFETAIDLCKTLPASLSILHVFEYNETVPPPQTGQPVGFEALYQEAERSLNHLLQTARHSGVPSNAEIAGGLAVATILETAAKQKTDLLILGTNAARGLERLVFGSTAEAVLRKASCPVITVGPRVRKSGNDASRPVIFATDFHPTTIHAVRYAASVCSATQSPLHCLTVLPMTTDAGAQSQIVPQVMTEALRHVAVSSGAVISPPVCRTICGADFPDTVIQYAKKECARMIVLGVQHAPAFVSHGPRDATYRLIVEAPCPVLTIATPPKQSEAANNHESEPSSHQNLQAAWLKRRTRVA
jgi:nucleotide-binding universal stress UspA family protein